MSRISLFALLAAVGCVPSTNEVENTNQTVVADPVRQAASALYIHGITEEVAHEFLSPTDVPDLIGLLEDPTFERRDNVVLFLGHLGDDTAVDAIMKHLETPVRDITIPEEDRAMLLSPMALGHLASKGSARAMQELLTMTAHGADGGVLAATAKSASDRMSEANQIRVRDDLLETAIWGLAYSQQDVAIARLNQLANGNISPQTQRDLESTAGRALASLEDGEDGGGPGGGTKSGILSSHAEVHGLDLTYANHPDLSASEAYTDSEVDDILAEASLYMGRADSSSDTSCCVTMQRSGSGKTWGSMGDGLDVVDSGELSGVLNDSTARVKVVRLLPSGAIGYAWMPGNGIAVIKYSTTHDPIIWAHELGHNVGLDHHSSNQNIMYAYVNTGGLLDSSQCNTYHAPSSSAGFSPAVMGTCEDNDADDVHDVLDNCPNDANTDQADSDGDGVGDVCIDGGTDTGGTDTGTTDTGSNDSGTTDTGTTDTGTTDTGTTDTGTSDTGTTHTGTGGDTGTPCVDNDGDGVTDCDGDCDDGDASINPFATEVCSDGIDQDCDGRDKTRGRACRTDDDGGGGPSGGDKERNCKNGIDDDGDGAIDCSDSDCSTKPSCR